MSDDRELGRVSFDYDENGVYRVRVGDRVFVPESAPAPGADAALALVEAMAYERVGADGSIGIEGLLGREPTALCAALSARAPEPTLRERLDAIFAEHSGAHVSDEVLRLLHAHAAAHPEDAEAVERMVGDA